MYPFMVKRFLKIVIVTIFAHKIFHKISKLDMWLSDRHAKFQVSAPVRARARRFLRFLLVKIFSDNFFHKIRKMYLRLSDRRAKFQVSAPVRALARSFLRFYVMGSAG